MSRPCDEPTKFKILQLIRTYGPASVRDVQSNLQLDFRYAWRLLKELESDGLLIRWPIKPGLSLFGEAT